MPDIAAVIVGEAVGLVQRMEPAAGIVRRLTGEAARLLSRAPAFLHPLPTPSAAGDKG